MSCLKFDIYAMTNPKTKQDYIALLDEAVATIEYVNEALDKAVEAMEKSSQKINGRPPNNLKR